MLDRLLESKARTARSPGGAMVSIAAHTALIAAAVYATAQARVVPKEVLETVRPIYFSHPSAPRLTLPATRATSPAPRIPTIHRVPDFVSTVAVAASTVDLGAVMPRATEFPASAVGSISPAGGGLPDDSSGGALTAEQVEKAVAVAPGNAPPQYPPALRNAGVSGKVVAIFVVNGSGRAEDTTVRFLHSDNVLFEDAARTALRRMRFIPAEVGGRKVRQLVQMPFVFTISK